MLLPQDISTQSETEYLLGKLSTNGKSQQIFKKAEKTTINLSFAEQQSIPKTNEKWFLGKLTERKDSKCCVSMKDHAQNKVIFIRDLPVYSTESNLI